MADRRFTTLDGLRGIAALAVVGAHAQGYFPGAPRLPGDYLAVDLFFALSGFVLCGAYGGRLDAGLSAIEFLKIRLVRLYPLYMFALIVALLLALPGAVKGSSTTFFSVPFAALMLPAPNGLEGQLYPLNPPAWSLFLELAINLAMATFWKVLTIRRIICVAAFAFLGLVKVALDHGSLDVGFNWVGFLGGLARVSFSFTIGVVIFKVSENHRLPSMPGWVAPILLLATLIIPSGGGAWIRDLSIVALGFPILIMVFARSEVGPTATRLFSFCGLTSYGVYVLHAPLLNATKIIALHAHIPMTGLPQAAAFLALATGSAWVVTTRYEALGRRIVSVLLFRSGPSKPLSAAAE